MGTTSQKLQNIVNCKAAVRTAVQNSLSLWGITLPDKLSDWADRLTNARTVKITGNVSNYEYSYTFGSRNLTYASTTKQPFADTITTVDLSGIGSVSESGFNGAFNHCASLSSVIFPDNGLYGTGSNTFNSMFSYCTNLKNATVPIRFSDKSSMFGGMFQYSGLQQLAIDFKFESGNYSNYILTNICRGCTPLTKFTMSGLKTLVYRNQTQPFFGMDGNNAFYGCTNLKEVEINDLETFNVTTTSGRGFGLVSGTGTMNIASVKCPDLKTITTSNSSSVPTQSFFVGTSSTSNRRTIQNIYLPKLTQVSPYAFNCVSNCTFHFGAENRTAIEALTNYSNHFSGYGGDTTTFVFDL